MNKEFAVLLSELERKVIIGGYWYHVLTRARV